MRAIDRFHRFILPDDWSPVGTWCLVVRVPADGQYVGQLIGLLDTLKFSANFQRDDTQTGASLVSRVWETALESAPIEIIDCGDIGMSSQRWRVKPGEPYTSQFSHDGGVTWTDYLIQPHWPTSGSSAGIPKPGVSGVTAGDIAAAILRNFYLFITGRMVNDIQGGVVSRVQTIDSIMAELAPYGAGAETRASLEQAYDILDGMTSGEQDATATEEDWCEGFGPMQQQIAEGGDNWLDELADILSQALNTTSSELSNTLNAAAGAMGFGGMDYVFGKGWEGGGGGGSGFGGGCPTSGSGQVTVDSNSYDYWTYTSEVFPAGVIYVRVSGTYEIAHNQVPCALSGRFSDSQFAQGSVGQGDPWTVQIAGKMKFQNTNQSFAPQQTYQSTHVYTYQLNLPADSVIGVKWTADVQNGCHDGEFLVEFSTTPF